MAGKKSSAKQTEYREVLERIAEDIESQFKLEKYQRDQGEATHTIDRSRADSYRRVAEMVEGALGRQLRSWRGRL